MKKRIRISAILLAATLLCFFTACSGTPQEGENNDPPPQDLIVVSVSVTTPPTKTEYMAGETFDKTGMVVTAKFNNNTTRTVTDYTVDKTVLRVEDTFVTVTYKQKKTTVAITVSPNTDPDNLIDLVISDAGSYKLEAEDILGDGDGYLYDPNSPAAPWTSGSRAMGYMKKNDPSGNPQVKVRFTAEKPLKVSINPVMSFYTAFDWAGLSVTLDETEITPQGKLGHAAVTDDSGDMARYWQNWVEVDFGLHTLEAGKHTLTLDLLVSDGPGMDYINFTAYEADATEGVRGLYLESDADKLVYTDGETFDTTGAVVKARLVVGEDVAVDSSEITVMPQTLTAEDKFVTLSYGGKTVREPIIVAPAPPVIEGTDVTLNGETVKLEAENLQCIDGTFIKAITPTVASEEGQAKWSGMWIDYLPANKPLSVYVGVQTAGKYTLKVSAGRYKGYSFAEHMTLAIDDEPQDLTEVSDIAATDYFHEPELIVLGTFELDAGEHTFVFVNDLDDGHGKGPGIDYFEFSPYDEPPADTEYTVTYDLDGGDGEAPTETNKLAGDTFEIAGAPTKEGYEFLGWKCGGTLYAAGDTFTVGTADVTFVAQWKKLYDATLGGAEQEYKIEAESLICVDGNNLKLCDPSDATDEGKAKWSGMWLDYLKENDVVEIKVNVTQAGTYSLKMSAGHYHGFAFTQDSFTVKLDDAIQTVSIAPIPFTDKFHEPQDVFICNFELAVGVHTVTLTCLATDGPGIDFFAFGPEYTPPAPPVCDVTLAGETVRAEAESLLCVDGATIKRANGDKWLDYLPVGVAVTIKVNVTVAGKYTVTINGGRYHGYSFEHLTVQVDGGEATSLAGVESIPATEDFFGDNLRELCTLELSAGEHTITFVNSHTSENLGGIGIDYFEFAPYAEPTEQGEN